MFTYFRTQYGKYKGIDENGYRLNEYFTYPLDDENTLVTTRHRAWVILKSEEYNLLLEHKVERAPELYSILEDLGIILTKRNIKDVAMTRCEQYSFLNQPPALFIMAPTNRCTNRCVYCHAKAELATDTRWDMKEEVAYKTVDFFFSIPERSDTFHIEFQGGEPLLRYSFIQKIMDYTIELGKKEKRDVRFAIVSNLTLMTDEIASDIKRRGNIHLCSSLDGPKDINDKQRVSANGKGTYDEVVYWLKRLREKYKMHIPILTTFTINHIGKEETLIDEYIELEQPDFILRYVNQVNPLEKTWAVRINSEQFLDSWRCALEYILKENKDGISIRELTTTHLLENMLTVSTNYMCLRKPCGAAISQIAVDHKGDIFICDQARSIDTLSMGNVMKNSYDEIITSPTALALRNIASETLPKCHSCAFSAYCGHCIVRSLREHGSPLPEGPNDFDCETYGKMIPYLFKKLMDKEDGAILNSWVKQ